jgi:predicted lipase
MIDWKLALKYARLVRAAEQVKPGAPTDDAVKSLVEQEGYTLLETVYGDDLATDLDPRLGLEVTFGFVAVSPDGEAVSVLRGTDNVWEWLEDGKFLMVPWGPGLTEDGFTGVYRSLRVKGAAAQVGARDYLLSLLSAGQAKRVTVCGHSLGGALATLLAASLAGRDVSSYTFASPRVGDHLFSGRYDELLAGKTFRVENRFDLVPKLPPPFPLPYEHVGERCELKGKFSFNPAQEHHLETYITLMEALA